MSRRLPRKTTPPRSPTSPRGARAPPPKTWADTCTDIRDGIWDCVNGVCNMISRKTRKRKSPSPSENSPLLQRMDRNDDDDSAYARRQKYDSEPFDYDDRPSQYPPNFEYHGNSNNPADLFDDLLNTDTHFIIMFDNINFSETQFLTIEELAKFIDTMPLTEEHKKELKIQARTNINFDNYAFRYDNFKEYLLNIYRTIPEHSKPKFIEFILNYNEERARKNPQNPQSPPKTTSSTKNTNPDKTDHEKLAKDKFEEEEAKAKKKPQNSKNPPKTTSSTKNTNPDKTDHEKLSKDKFEEEESKFKKKLEEDESKADKAKAEAEEDKSKAEARSLKAEEKARIKQAARMLQEAREARASKMPPGRAQNLTILGLGSDASKREIKKAYLTLTVIWHTDKNIEDVEYAEERIKKINAAYADLERIGHHIELDKGGKTRKQSRKQSRKQN